MCEQIAKTLYALEIAEQEVLELWSQLEEMEARKLAPSSEVSILSGFDASLDDMIEKLRGMLHRREQEKMKKWVSLQRPEQAIDALERVP